MFENLVSEFIDLPEVEAILLGGSRATGVYDEDSDYDLYVYLNAPVTLERRKEILSKYVSYMEYSNQFWELEDDGVLKNGVEIELIYRDMGWMNETLENLLVKGYVSNGYTTCFVDNLIKSKVLYDKNNTIGKLKSKYLPMLNVEIFSKIIEKNFPILLDYMPSIFYQIEKAMKRSDLLSINHRITAFFEMYFDIVFALNQETHPGEKRLLEMATNLDKVPLGLQSDIHELFSVLFSDYNKSLDILERIVVELHLLLEKEGYHFTLRSFK